MDIRRKTFVGEATRRLEFLLQECGFVGPEVQGDGEYPLLIRVRYHRSDVDVEECLVLSYGGEEYVKVILDPADQVSGPVARAEVSSDTAHTGFQMRQALDRHARTLRQLFGAQPPGRRTT